jgi:ATP-binding cassette subfamily F protein 3
VPHTHTKRSSTRTSARVAARTPTFGSSSEQRKLDAQKRQQQAAQIRPLKKELEQNEQRMTAIAQEKSALEQLLSTSITPAEIAESGRRLKALNDEETNLEERWLELTASLEAAA